MVIIAKMKSVNKNVVLIKDSLGKNVPDEDIRVDKNTIIKCNGYDVPIIDLINNETITKLRRKTVF